MYENFKENIKTVYMCINLPFMKITDFEEAVIVENTLFEPFPFEFNYSAKEIKLTGNHLNKLRQGEDVEIVLVAELEDRKKEILPLYAGVIATFEVSEDFTKIKLKNHLEYVWNNNLTRKVDYSLFPSLEQLEAKPLIWGRE